MDRKLKAAGKEWKTPQDYFEVRIAEPIGMDVARLGVDRGGAPNFAGGAMLTAREWAKFGQFVLQQGSWTSRDGTGATGADDAGPAAPVQIIRPELLAQCFVPSEQNPSYGLTWWLLDSERAGQVADASGSGGSIRERLRSRRLAREGEAGGGVAGPDGNPLKVYMAAGLGKQRLLVIPQQNLVIVRFAENAAPSRERKDFSNVEFLKLVLGKQ
jgi:CubicO group peptidase (beta-lactamase class C family)